METTEVQLAARQSLEATNAVIEVQSEADLAALQKKIDGDIYSHIFEIHRAIGQAASDGLFVARFTASERIATRINPPEVVQFIKTVTDSIASVVAEQLEAEGYGVDRHTLDVADYRDRDDAPPEYYDTHFTVSWQPDRTK